MSNGFTVRAFSVLAGSTEFPSGSGSTLCRQRSDILLTKSVECVLNANRGWVLDPRTPTVTSYIEIPAMNNGQSMPGLLLKNTESGCKMFMAYFGTEYTYGIKNFNNNSNLRSNGSYAFQTGLIISIIPENSDNDFGEPSTESFVPDDATRLVGSAYGKSISTAYKVTDGWGYVYSFGITPRCVFLYASHSTSGEFTNPNSYLYVPIYAVGKILESVVHGEEASNALYGVINFRYEAAEYESWAGPYRQNILSVTANTITTIGMGNIDSKTGLSENTDNISNIDGDWLGNKYNTNYRIIHFAINPNILTFTQHTGSIAWSALGVGVMTNDLTNYGITSTDCFKGIVDTDLFRAIANGTRGSLYCNNNFCCPEDNYGLIIGWDSSNANLI